MKKQYLFNILLVSLAAILLLTAASPAQGAQNKVRVFVEFSPGAKNTVKNALNGAGAQYHYTFDHLNSFVVTVPEQALNGLSKNPNVVAIEEDALRYPIVSTLSTEPLSQLEDIVSSSGDIVPFGVDAVQARDVWDTDGDGDVDAGANAGAGIKVCIIDTGYYGDHEDLPDLTAADGYSQVDDNYYRDGYGHGSHVAGTIAGEDNDLGVIGVAPNVSFFIVKYFADDGNATYASDLIDASSTCAANGADVISMSLGGTRATNRERRNFDTLYSQGVLSIAAAGNDGNTEYSYPASYDSVVSVAAVDESNAIADFSQQNDQVEVAAPGVAVLSTIPYIDENSLTVAGVDYDVNHVEYAARGTASGALVDGGLCDTTGSWSGAVVLCQRGDISFYDKVINVQNSGGAAAIIYNNEEGNFFGTLGDEASSSDIIAMSMSQADGQYLIASQLGATATMTSTYTWPASGYEAWNGTSMATPHVSAVAALIWSEVPTATNADIRDALSATAMDLGTAGYDVAFGYGLVQAADAIAYLGGGTGNTAPSVAITSPASGTSVEDGTAITFTASASDVEDGDLSGSVAWTSSLDGALGTGASLTATLSVGTHTITASVTDSGSLTATDSITVTVTGGTSNTAPSVAITSPASGTSVEDGTAITFTASASDVEDGDLSGSVAWTSSLDGALGTGASLTATLSVGTHIITASVTDSGGLTATDSITVTVTGGTGGALVVAVSTNAPSYGDRTWVTITVEVTDGSAPVANATVDVTMTTGDGGTKYYTGSTAADGTAVFTYKTFIRKDGSGTFTVDVTASASGYTDGSASTTFLVQ